jgi:GntR family transcriptional repressor for pyruvate dehydrogenase complex
MEKIPRVNLSEIVADKIYKDIRDNRLKPGDQLPPHEELCERWGVSRVTLREALKKLDTKGLVEIHQGRGTFVRNYNRDLIENQFEFHSLLGEKTIIQLFEARKVVETALVELVTVRASDKEIDSLDSVLEKMAPTVQEGDHLQFARFDLEFHKIIGSLAKNEVLQMMLEKIQFLIEAQQREMFEYAHDSNPLESSYEDHIQICRMIRRRDSKAAADQMYQHIQHMENRVRAYYSDASDTTDSASRLPAEPERSVDTHPRGLPKQRDTEVEK